MSPRRSSRSKTSHPTTVPQNAHSSSSSSTSGRADRRSRSTNKPTSSRASIAPRSPVLEDRNISAKTNERRTRSSQELSKVEADNAQEDEDLDEENPNEDDEEEITRCVCGQQDYPGMPITAPKSIGEPDGTKSTAAPQGDTGGMFIQCDICKVWQHGGCVGIMDEATSPEEYFCEQCRKELHTIRITATGQRHSIYLPVQKPSPPPSPESAIPQEHLTRKLQDSRSSRLGPEGTVGKRRSTMNSRDAAYYEAEQLRRAIEESKKDGAPADTSASPRLKRSREGSDQRDEDNKRRRTESGSSSTSNGKRPVRDEVENEDTNAGVSSIGKNIRSAAVRDPRHKELREREEKRDQDRLVAAGRRKGRAERRRGDEPDRLEEPPPRTTLSGGAGQHAVKTPPGPPPGPPPPPLKASHHKKTGRPPARRGRVGRNQYTRDRDRSDAPKNSQSAISPAHSQSSKEEHASPRVNGHSHETGKPTRSRHTNPGRTSMIEMKRRVAGILEFISRTQVEMAAEIPLAPKPHTATTLNASTAETLVTPSKEEQEPTGGHERRLAWQQQKLIGTVTADLDFEQFQALTSVEMMEALTRKLMRWQGDYGKYGEK
ncbi:MAG: hypothetical protein Q9219_004528 [cf. Caloplaca sp. 3 TL-2023]